METVSIEQVRRYWDRYINNTNILTNATEIVDPDSITFEDFQTMRNWRYSNVMSHVLPTMDKENYEGCHLLEIGCSMGFDSVELARIGANVTGIDLSPKSIELAKRYAALSGCKCTFKIGNAESLEFPDNSFDRVYTIGVLHHVPNIAKAIFERS